MGFSHWGSLSCLLHSNRIYERSGTVDLWLQIVVGVLCLLAGGVLVFFSFTGFRSFLFSSRGSLVNTAVFAIVLLVGTSQGQASSAYKNAAADSKTAAAIIGYEVLSE